MVYWMDGLPVNTATATDTGFVYWMDGLPVANSATSSGSGTARFLASLGAGSWLMPILLSGLVGVG